MEKGKLIFITGGVRSGKSAFAEQLAIHSANRDKGELHYIACGIPFDLEMQERVKRHQADRQQSGVSWETWEQPTHIDEIVSRFTKQDTVLLDCVTTLLNNYLYKENRTDTNDIISQVIQDIIPLQKQTNELIVVSNEVLHDIPFHSEQTRQYQYMLGNIHQELVKQAEQAILVESGIPVYMKGGSI
jgi:adenosylcobinamide kinase/adenosylcobinamide-phosphate guanylyltransferase